MQFDNFFSLIFFRLDAPETRNRPAAPGPAPGPRRARLVGVPRGGRRAGVAAVRWSRQSQTQRVRDPH